MRKIFIIFIALFFATIATNSTYAQDAQARTLLDAMSNKYKKYNSFRATFTSTLLLKILMNHLQEQLL